MSGITIELPWPPSINHYYLRRGNRTFIGPKGVEYRKSAIIICKPHIDSFPNDKRLHMSIECYPPDRRKRDLDNLGKCIADSLQHARVYADDSQIDFLSFERMPNLYGKVLIYIKEIKGTAP